jgi:hypothetical protein
MTGSVIRARYALDEDTVGRFETHLPGSLTSHVGGFTPAIQASDAPSTVPADRLSALVRFKHPWPCRGGWCRPGFATYVKSIAGSRNVGFPNA